MIDGYALPLDVGCDLPDELFDMLVADQEEFGRRVLADDDFCVLDVKSPGERIFLRGLLDVPVQGAPRPFSYGVWYEVDLAAAKAIAAAWDDDEAWMSLRVQGRLANALVPFTHPVVGACADLAASSPSTRLRATSCDDAWVAALMVRGWTADEHRRVIASVGGGGPCPCADCGGPTG